MLKIFKYMSIMALSVLLCANAAIAKTPDGKPPSEETICDVFKGGAFGLCNAYCEAMDCGDLNQAASQTACDQVRSNFEERYSIELPEGRFDFDSCIVADEEPPPEA